MTASRVGDHRLRDDRLGMTASGMTASGMTVSRVGDDRVGDDRGGDCGGDDRGDDVRQLDGETLGYYGMIEAVVEVYTAAKVDKPPKPIHCLRHTFGTVMAKKARRPSDPRRRAASFEEQN